MRILCAILLVTFGGLFIVVTSFGEDISSGSASGKVEAMCQSGEVVSAFHLAMRSFLDTRAKYGPEHLKTADCMVTLGDVARLRGKHYLAERLYNRALTIGERNLGPADPKVISCKLKLTQLLSGVSK